MQTIPSLPKIQAAILGIAGIALVGLAPITPTQSQGHSRMAEGAYYVPVWYNTYVFLNGYR